MGEEKIIITFICEFYYSSVKKRNKIVNSAIQMVKLAVEITIRGSKMKYLFYDYT